MLNKTIPVFRVTRPYLNLLVKPRIFSGFLDKKILEKYVCLLYLKFSDLLTETHLFFLFGLIIVVIFCIQNGSTNGCVRPPG